MEDKIKEAIEFLEKNGYEVYSPIIQEVDDSFDKWWNLYNKKRGRVKCEKKWKRMSRKDREACLAATPAYVNSIEEKVYQKDPFTYLNQRGWEDEIINPDRYERVQPDRDFAQKAARILMSD